MLRSNGKSLGNPHDQSWKGMDRQQEGRKGKGKSHEQTGKQEGRRKGKGEKTGRVEIKGKGSRGKG